MTVAKLLHDARVAQGASLRDVAAYLNITHTTVHAWETGRLPVPLARLPALCKALRLDYESVVRPLWSEEQAGRDHALLERAAQRLEARRGAA